MSPRGLLIVIISAVAGAWPEQELWRQPRVRRVWRPSRQQRVLLLLAVLALLLLIPVALVQHAEALRAARSRQSLHMIQLALERHSLDQLDRREAEGLPYTPYASSIDELRTTGYLGELPLNAYSGRPMREVNWREHGRGDFTFVPLPIRVHLEGGEVVDGNAGYMLLLWGNRWSARDTGWVEDRTLKSRRDLPLDMVLSSPPDCKWLRPETYRGRRIEALEYLSDDDALLAIGLSADNQ